MKSENSPTAIKVEWPPSNAPDEPISKIPDDDKSPKEAAAPSAQDASQTEGTREFVTWDGPDDPENPKNWSYAYKWWITTIMCILSIDVTFASAAPAPGLRFIARDLHVSAETANLVTTMFLLGYVGGPPVWGPGSELLGRKYISLFAVGLFSIFNIGQARAQNIGTLLVTRFLSGFFACAPLINVGGIIADIWDPIGGGHALGIFCSCVFIGPVLGPIIGGYIVTSHLGWRWVFWVLLISGAACTVFGLIFLPETYAPTILARKARRLRKLDPVANKNLFAETENKKWTLRELLHSTIIRPFTLVAVEPILLLVTAYISVIYGIIYGLLEAYPLIFAEKRGLTIPQTGLMFLGVGIGAVFSVMVNWYYLRPYPQLIKEWRGFPPPENRLPPAMIAGPVLVVGILWLGWTGNYSSIPWYVPVIGSILVGMGIILIFISFLAYVLDTYLKYAASAFAANCMIRSAVAAAFPLFTTQMFKGMGINWAATLLAGISVVLAMFPFIFYKYGPRIRSGSKYAPCMDLKIARELAEERRKKETGEV